MGFIEIHRLLASWAHSFLLDGKEEMVSQASRLIGPSCCAVSAWKMDDQVPSASSAAGEVLLSSFNFPSGPYCNFPIRLLALSPPPPTHTPSPIFLHDFSALENKSMNHCNSLCFHLPCRESRKATFMFPVQSTLYDPSVSFMLCGWSVGGS